MDTPKNKKGRKRSSNNKENKQKVKKQKTAKCSSTSTTASIAMSTQLALKKKRQVRKSRYTDDVRVCLDNESKVCVNGKQMPALADLEMMFEDSDDDETSSLKPVQKPPNTPTKETTPSENKLLSPNTVKTIADRMMDMISKVSDPSEILNIRPPSPDIPHPPVIPPKKIKKCDIPYIVGCKDRPRVEKTPTTSFCKGADDYGISGNIDELENELPKKRARKSKIKPYSKSIFNSKSKEIAKRLMENESIHDRSINGNVTINDDCHSYDSSDSNKTVDYNIDSYNTSIPFTPIPSTSKNNKIFIENDNLFNKSLAATTVARNTSEEDDKDIEIVEVPCETIGINDLTDNDISIKEEKDNSCIEITECIENERSTIHPKVCFEADDDCIFISDNSNKNNINENNIDITTIVIDDEYANINIDHTFQSDDIEVIDVDSLIEESKSIIDKIQKSKQSESIIEVVEVNNTTEIQQTDSVNNSNNNENVTHNSNSINVETNVPNNATADNKTTCAVQNSTTNHCTGSCNPISYVIAQVVADFFEKYYVNNTNNIHQDLNNSQKCWPNNINLSNRQTVQSVQGSTTNISSSDQSRHTAFTSNRPINLDSHYGASLSSSTPIPKTSRKKQTKITAAQSTPSVIPANLSPRSNTKNLGECPICMESLSNNPMASTICGHVFCLKCIQAAVKSSGKRCPTCRKALKGAGFHQLYL